MATTSAHRPSLSHPRRVVVEDAMPLQVDHDDGPVRAANVDGDDDAVHLEQVGGGL